MGEESKTLLLESRADLAPPTPGAPVNAAFRSVLVPGAERLTGYVALASAPALRLVISGGEERLERRDGRTTPVTGEVAWFYRDGFDLGLRVERRASETEARFTGYALPMAGALEIHGQIDYRFLHAGVDTVKVRVPADVADAFFFTGAHVAERRREGDVWTIHFQGEQTGDYVLGVQATIPTPADKDDAERFHFRLPTISPLDTARSSGEWAVEANTDTEISFHAVGANEVDTLRAPVLAGYQPRRRVIGVFEFLGNGAAEAAIDVDGLRHPAAGVAAAVVDSLTLETFASTSGVARHRATLRARTAGDGFFNVRLPDGAALWSLTRDGALVKPVGGAAGELRVELPGGRDPSTASTVVVVYETPGQPWAGSGKRTLAAPRFDPGVPVVNSRWTLHMPDGFDYRMDGGALAVSPATVSPGDLLLPQIGGALGHAVQWAYYYPQYRWAVDTFQGSGIGDPAHVTNGLPAWMAAWLGGVSSPPTVTELDTGPVLGESAHDFALPKPVAANSASQAAGVTFIAPVERVKQLFADAQNFYDAGRYDLADKRYEQILAIDPYNDVARKGQERVGQARVTNGKVHDQTRDPVLAQVDQGWDLPRSRLATDAAARRNIGKVRDEQVSATITRKLDSIIIPSIEFRSTTLGDAIEFLRQESRRLDPDPDPEQRGVNIFLKLPGAGSPANTRITLTMSRLPLLEALKYVAQQAGLKVKVEQYAVSIVPLSEVTDTLVTQEFRVSPTFIQSQTTGSLGGGALSQGATSATATASEGIFDATGTGAVNISRQDAKTFLEASGVTFPPGASATYLPTTGKLVVRNTQENLDLIDSLRQENSPARPTPPTDDRVTLNGQEFTTAQIKTAEARSSIFGNNQLATAEFSVSPDFLAGLSGTSGSKDVTGTGSVTLQRQDAKSFLEAQGFSFPPGASVTYLPSTRKLVMRNTPDAIKQMSAALAAPGSRSGTFGISANSIDALLFDGTTGRESEARVSGLLPIQLDLPNNGIAYGFGGGGEPGTLSFRYTDWRSAARWRWTWLTLGATAFLLFAAGWAHPWRRTLWVVLALTFWPLIAAPSWLTPCNALLAGWLWAVLGWVVTRWLLRRRRFVTMAALLAAAALPIAAHAAPAPAPAPGPETVIVPYDATRPAFAQQPARYYLPYERFLTLWDAAKSHRRPAAPEPPPGGDRYTLNTARYHARLVGDSLEIDATLDFQTFGDGWVAVPLPLDGAFTLDDAPAALGDGGVLTVGRSGAHRLAASLRLPAANLAAGSELSWSIPRTAATLVTFTLPRPDLRAEVHSDTPGGVIEETVPEGRRYLAAAGGAAAIKLVFRDAAPPAPSNGEPALARIVSRLTVGAGQEMVRSEIRFPFAGRTQDHFTVYLDPGLTLTGLDAPGVKAWHLSTGGERQTLDLALEVPARDAYALSLEADRPVPPDARRQRTFPTVSAQAARIEQTAVLLTGSALELSLPDGLPPGTRRTEWTARPDEAERVFGAFGSDGSPALVYSVTVRPEKRAAHIDYLYQPGRGKIEWAASVRLVPAAAGAPIQAADLRLPAGATVQAVAGGSVRQWWHEGDVLSLRFGTNDAGGEVSFIVYLVQATDAAPGTITLHPLTALGFTDTDGESIVAANRSLRVGLTLPTGVRAHDLSEVKPDRAAGEFEVKPPLERQRAFRYRNGFEIGVTLEVLPARWETQAVTRATVREGTVALETHVNIQAQQGALDALEFSLPAGLPEASVSGPEVREAIPLPVPAGQDRQTYRVLWQNPVYGGSEAAFTVALELPLGAGGRAALPDLRFPGARLASTFLLVENASSGEMTLDPHGLDPAIEKDMPFLPAQIVAGTRFFRVAPGTPWSLGISLATLEETAGRAALVAYAELTSTLRADGEEWHRATYRLQNRRLQFLPVELPHGVEFIGARVAGESVRVDAGGPNAGTLLVPLLRTRPGELSYDVELIYRRPAPGPRDAGRRTWGHWRLDDPKLPGIPVEKTLWDVFLPTDTRLLSSGGNVEPVVAALNETEKLESALSDLRSLSATYRSASATRQEQQLALNNFNALAADVKSKARVEDRSRVVIVDAPPALLKQRDVASQNASVSRKQRTIQNELDSLNAANVAALPSSGPVGQSGSLGRAAGNVFTGSTTITSGTLAINGAIGGGFDGSVSYGSPIRPTDSGQLAASVPLQENWRDNRTLDQNRPGAFDLKVQSAAGAVTAGKKQLALNDSVAVDLPASPNLPAKEIDAGRDVTTTDHEDGEESRLDTARAVAGPAVAAQPAGTPASPENAKVLREPANSPEVPSGERIESLRSVGRISLAVNFPQEGQVYHFKKLRADARLTLWSVRPAAFERLGWLLVLTVLLAGSALVRRVARRVSRSSAFNRTRLA